MYTIKPIPEFDEWLGGIKDTMHDSHPPWVRLYKALRPDSKPLFDTISRVCKALGVRLVAQPVPL